MKQQLLAGMLFLGFTGLAGTVLGQASDAPAHDHGSATPEPMVMDRDSATPEPMVMEHANDTPADSSALRDPHAYSDGYTLESGPYAAEPGSRISLADEMTFAGLWLDRFEYVAKDGKDAMEVEGQVWRGDSYNRIVLRTEAALVNGSVDDAEIDLMLSHAVAPFWDLQVGFRHQIANDHHRHWAILGFNGLAPYWFELDASLFATDSGQLFYDLEAEYELRLNQRLVLQPRIDIHSFSETDAQLGHGAGLSKAKLGARLRYEFSRQFAPYLGVERVSSFGKTAELLPVDQKRRQTWWTVGVKFWF